MRTLLLLIIVLLAACEAPPAEPTLAVRAPTAAAAAPPLAAPSLSPAFVVTATTVSRSTSAPPTATPLPRYDLVLTGATLIDGTGTPPVPDATVAILDGRIAAVGATLAYRADTPVRDLAGATLMPGFINAHAHTAGLDDEELRAWTRAGITTVRDLGGPLAEVTARRYLVETADSYRVATLDRRLASISYHHKQARHALPTKDPEVERTMRDIRRAKGMAPNGKAPLLPAQLRQAIEALPDTLLGKRDHALLVIGFAGAFRRSELVALTMEDIQTTHEGLIVTLRRSKTDQKGQTMVRGLPKGTSESTCPVRVLEQWVTAAKITTGPIFRPVNRYGTVGKNALSGLAVPRIVKEALTRAGIDAKDYSGHSLRAGLVTAAAMAGVSERIIMLQTGHKNIAVLRRYIREGSVFRENAAAAVGL